MPLLVQEKQGEIDEMRISLAAQARELKKLTRMNALTSVNRNLRVNTTNVKALSQSLPSCNILSEDVVALSEDIIGGGTFGIIREGFFKILGSKCAIKIGKHVHFVISHLLFVYILVILL